MARGDGIDRTNARNMRLTETKIGNTQQHNEREKDSYVNQDIVLERTPLNVHFKTPSAGYREMFARMEADGVISTRGIKEDAFRYGELVFDVNSAYFYNHGGYDFAKQFYTEAYKAAIKIVGGEQYILSAIMHADERNRAMSEVLGEDVYHYHLHVVYIPVVEKEIRWTKRCKDKSLVGKVKETIMQVSMSKKWTSKPILDETTGEPLRTAKGKPVLRKSYSILQDDFFEHMRSAGYDDIERGERGSSEEHLTVTQFKTEREQERLAQLQEASALAQVEADKKNNGLEKRQRRGQQPRRKRPRLGPNWTMWLPYSRAWRSWQQTSPKTRSGRCRRRGRWNRPSLTERRRSSPFGRRLSRCCARSTGPTSISRAGLSGCRSPMIVRSVRTALCQLEFMRSVPRGTA